MKVLRWHLQGYIGQKHLLQSLFSHMASKCVAKPKNGWGTGWYISMCKTKLLVFYFAVPWLYFLIHTTWGWKWTDFFAACNSGAQVLCWPYPAQQKNSSLAPFKSVCLPFPSCVPGYPAQMPCWAMYMPVICLAAWTRAIIIFLGLGGVEQIQQE